MSTLISKEVVFEVIFNEPLYESGMKKRTAVDVVPAIYEKIKSLPAAQPERKKGKWSFIGDNMFECTCCGTPYTTQQLNGLRNYNTDPYAPKFCPNCGADMRGEQE